MVNVEVSKIWFKRTKKKFKILKYESSSDLSKFKDMTDFVFSQENLLDIFKDEGEYIWIGYVKDVATMTAFIKL